ncbi:hypothetical protein HDU91_001657, partial [Kappamyces sp. JEL0680]
MMDTLPSNPLGGQTTPQEYQRQQSLQKERNEDLKRFLAQQAANTHPRLARLLKKNEAPLPSITELKVKAAYANQRHPQPVAPAPPPAPSHSAPLPQQQIPYQQRMPQEPHLTMNPSPQPYANYPMQAASPYQMGGYQPNPYLPPMHFNPYEAGYLKYPFLGGGYRDPYSMHYPQSTFPTSPAPDMYSHPSQGQVPHPSPYAHYLPVQAEPSRYGPAHSRNPAMEDRERNIALQQGKSRHGRPENPSKQEYAAELERQISEKNERTKYEKKLAKQPDSGFLGGPSRYADDQSNDGYESSHSAAAQTRLQQQSRYNRELNEQIRIKNEMKQKELQKQYSQEYLPQAQSPTLYPAEL